MPIQNLNGTWRKNAVVHSDKPLFVRGQASNQHVSTGVVGTSYSSPFSPSSNPPLGNQFDTATQPQLPAMQVEQPGVVVNTNSFQKVPPSEKGKSFTKTTPIKI